MENPDNQEMFKIALKTETATSLHNPDAIIWGHQVVPETWVSTATKITSQSY